jgi:LacI family transcriptional regulator
VTTKGQTRPRGPVTQADLARLLKLDRSSVSLALSNSSKVSAETRERVRLAAQRFQYRPNVAARQLKGARPQILGLVLPDRLQTLSEPVVVRTIQALGRLASERGVTLSIFSARADGAGSEASLPIVPDGLFIWGDMPAGALDGRIPASHPVLVLDPNHPSYAGRHDRAVTIDNAGGAAAMVRHLAERGGRRLLFVMTSPEHIGHRARWDGARAEWMRLRPEAQAACCTLEELGDEALRAFAARPDGAIFCSSDLGAAAVWRRLAVMGLAAPKDVRLAGFDYTPVAEWLGLTSAVFDSEGLARSALAAMLDLLAGKAPAEPLPVVPVSVRVGSTT